MYELHLQFTEHCRKTDALSNKLFMSFIKILFMLTKEAANLIKVALSWLFIIRPLLPS